MADLIYDRSYSASSNGGSGRAQSLLSTFSAEYDSDSTAPTTPSESPREFEEGDDEDIIEIDQKTFEANVKQAQNAALDFANMKIVNGSTFGGIDPVHEFLRKSGSEPRWWQEERGRNDRSNRRPPMTKRKRSAPTEKFNTIWLDPEWYDALPYSRQDNFTSGLDMNEYPEFDSEEFWDKVWRAWRLSIHHETVEERRDSFEEDHFMEDTPVRQPNYYEQELAVGEEF